MTNQDLVLQILADLNSADEGRLAGALRAAALLAKRSGDEEHRLLFEMHLDGFDPETNTHKRIQPWPDRTRQPRFDVVKAVFADRAIPDGQVQGLPIDSLVYGLQGARRLVGSAADQANSQFLLEGVKLEQAVLPVLTRIRNRISSFATAVVTTNDERSLIQAPNPSRIFLGHGRSLLWQQLRDYLVDVLHLDWDEFNREPTAGYATAERLQQMLSTASFAFLVLTAEDDQVDGTTHARANVIHELGLFQAKLGYRKAIILLEDGCSEFSNIVGLTQIRFPLGEISAIFDEIRRVLEREQVIPRVAR